jgi:putative flippase GtrA
VTARRSPVSELQEMRAVRVGLFVRWLRFNLVGGIGIALQLGLLFLMKSALHLNYLAATALAVETTVIHNFLWHERYTWVDRVADRVADRARPSYRQSLARLLRFNLTNGAISMLGNLALMKIAVAFGHINYLAANGIAILVCSLLNFLVSNAYVFDEPHGSISHAPISTET